MKVNYSASALFRALRGDSTDWRGRLSAQLRALLGVDAVLLTPSGRAGLYVLLRALPHTRVVIPAYTCPAVTEAARLAGKRVVYAPVEAAGFNMPARHLEGLLDAQTVVLATHQFGIPCDIEAIVARAHAAGAFVIEDAAAALGTRVNGRLVGTFGDAAAFSFDSTKQIHVPLKAGCVVAKDPALLARARALYAADIEPMPRAVAANLCAQAAIIMGLEAPALYRAFHLLRFQLPRRTTADTGAIAETPGLYYRYDVTQWQARLASEQLEQLDALIARRQALYARYRARLAGCAHFTLPPEDAERAWACVRFPIQIHGDKYDFYWRAAARGVDFAFSFSTTVCGPGFPRADALAARVLDLPFYPKLTDDEFEAVVRVLQDLEA
jgi:dTDP-4-amino-4,6-dideoxygalactose transaminase